MALAKLCFDTLMEEGVKPKSLLKPAANLSRESHRGQPFRIGFESAGLQDHASTTASPHSKSAITCTTRKVASEPDQLVLENVPLDRTRRHHPWCIEVAPVTLAEPVLKRNRRPAHGSSQNRTQRTTPSTTCHSVTRDRSPPSAADAYGRYYLDEEE